MVWVVKNKCLVEKYHEPRLSGHYKVWVPEDELKVVPKMVWVVKNKYLVEKCHKLRVHNRAGIGNQKDLRCLGLRT